MTAQHDLDRQLNAFLLDGPTELPDPSFDAVRHRIEGTRQRAVIGPWRLPDIMNKYVPIGLGAAAVVVALVVGTQLLGGSTSGGVGAAPPATPAPTTAPSPTPEPTPEPTPDPEGLLPVGPHMILDPEDGFRSLTVTIPGPGWNGEVGGGILLKNDRQPPDGSGMIIFVRREYIVYGDACNWRTTVPDSPATTVDEFVAALSSQGSRDASEPVDITLGGYAGKSITLRVPDDVDFAECDPGYGGSWDCGDEPCGYHTGAPTEIDTVYILDVDGRIVAWLTNYHAGTSAEDVAELEAIVQSASFGQ